MVLEEQCQCSTIVRAFFFSLPVVNSKVIAVAPYRTLNDVQKCVRECMSRMGPMRSKAMVLQRIQLAMMIVSIS